MAWIESHQELREHPKVYRLMDILKITKPQVLGHLHLFWWWCVDYALTGRLEGFNDLQLARAAEWSDEPKVFVEALLETRFLDRSDGVLTVHDWQDFCGALILKRLERQKLSAKRQKLSAYPTVPNQPNQPNQPEEALSSPPSPPSSPKEQLAAVDKSKENRDQQIKTALTNIYKLNESAGIAAVRWARMFQNRGWSPLLVQLTLEQFLQRMQKNLILEKPAYAYLTQLVKKVRTEKLQEEAKGYKRRDLTSVGAILRKIQRS